MEVDYRISEGKGVILKGYAWAIYGLNALIELITDWFGIGY